MTDTNTGSESSGRKPLLPGQPISWAIGIAVFMTAVLICCGLGVSTKMQDGYKQEHDLTAAYDNNRNQLALCIDTAVVAAGYTKEQAEQMSKALIAANGGANANALMGAGATPAGFAAILVKQMPDLKPYEAAFARGFNATVGCRNGFADYQRNLINKVKVYKDWKSSPTNLSKLFVSWPSDELLANNGTNEVDGDEALTRITNIITNTGATDAYNTGKYDAPDPFASKPAPTPAATPAAVPSEAPASTTPR